jgi:hypothetical protein
MHIGYWWKSQMERDHWEDQDIVGWRILKMALRYDRVVWARSVFLNFFKPKDQ